MTWVGQLMDAAQSDARSVACKRHVSHIRCCEFINENDTQLVTICTKAKPLVPKGEYEMDAAGGQCDPDSTVRGLVWS